MQSAVQGGARSLITVKPVARHCALLIVVVLVGDLRLAKAQDNYEIQVYGSDTVAPKTTMLELHSNFTAEGSNPAPGSRFTAEGPYPTNHAEHETVEITQGVNGWSEVGFYIFTSARSGDGWQWVGDHIRPRVQGARQLALAGGRKPLHGVRLSAGGVFAGHMDNGAAADHR